MRTIALAQLSVIPYLDVAELGDRFISCLTFYDDGWHMWLPLKTPDEPLFKMTAVPAEAAYFSKEPAALTDLFLPFLDFLSQCGNFRLVEHWYAGIKDDLFNISASLAKLALIETSDQAIRVGLSRMAATEVEYLVTVLRSMFDLFQETVAKLWATVTLLDKNVKKRELSPHFNRVVNFVDRPSSAEEIASRYGLPMAVAKCYFQAQAVFGGLRLLRDKIVHGGGESPQLFFLDERLHILEKDNPFPYLKVWTEEERRPNGLVPLLPLLQTLVFLSFKVCDDLVNALMSTIQFPPPIAPDLRLFLRGYFTEHLVAAIKSGSERRGTLLA